jgi:hypothetical protein
MIATKPQVPLLSHRRHHPCFGKLVLPGGRPRPSPNDGHPAPLHAQKFVSCNLEQKNKLGTSMAPNHIDECSIGTYIDPYLLNPYDFGDHYFAHRYLSDDPSASLGPGLPSESKLAIGATISSSHRAGKGASILHRVGYKKGTPLQPRRDMTGLENRVS